MGDEGGKNRWDYLVLEAFQQGFASHEAHLVVDEGHLLDEGQVEIEAVLVPLLF